MPYNGPAPGSPPEPVPPLRHSAWPVAAAVAIGAAVCLVAPESIPDALLMLATVVILGVVFGLFP